MWYWRVCYILSKSEEIAITSGRCSHIFQEYIEVRLLSLFHQTTQQLCTCSKSTKETLDNGVKFV